MLGFSFFPWSCDSCPTPLDDCGSFFAFRRSSLTRSGRFSSSSGSVDEEEEDGSSPKPAADLGSTSTLALCSSHLPASLYAYAYACKSGHAQAGLFLLFAARCCCCCCPLSSPLDPTTRAAPSPNRRHDDGGHSARDRLGEQCWDGGQGHTRYYYYYYYGRQESS